MFGEARGVSNVEKTMRLSGLAPGERAKLESGIILPYNGVKGSLHIEYIEVT
jgi:hypothetical protein